jgi:tRNA (adenine57-N1/adenine58-N1)-methyltransferase
MPIEYGDHVIITRGPKQSWLVRLEPGKQFHSNFGAVRHDDIAGKEYGDVYIAPDTKLEFMLLKPLLHELATRFARKTQIVYPKDAGFVIVDAGILPGSRVLEAGTGSGAMTMLLCAIAGAKAPGTVVSYEIEEKHHTAAKRNLATAGLSDMADLRLGNVFEPEVQAQLRVEPPFDVCFFDLPSPWDIVPFAHDMLAPCGVFVGFSPVIEQVKKTVEALSAGFWYDIHAVDLQLRSWQVRPNATRPASHGRHTGYLVIARRVNTKPPMEWTRKNRKELSRKLAADGEFHEDLDDIDMGIFSEGFDGVDG